MNSKSKKGKPKCKIVNSTLILKGSKNTTTNNKIFRNNTTRTTNDYRYSNKTTTRWLGLQSNGNRRIDDKTLSDVVTHVLPEHAMGHDVITDNELISSIESMLNEMYVSIESMLN